MTTHDTHTNPADALLKHASIPVARKATRYLAEGRVKLVAWNPRGNVRTFLVHGRTGVWPVVIDVDDVLTTCACPSGRQRPTHEHGPICSHVLAATCFWADVPIDDLPPLPEQPAALTEGVRCGNCNRGNTRDDYVVYHASANDVRDCYAIARSGG